MGIPELAGAVLRTVCAWRVRLCPDGYRGEGRSRGE
jgi:hypothetical protein